MKGYPTSKYKIGPVDQGKIAAFARRRPRVQIPPGPFTEAYLKYTSNK